MPPTTCTLLAYSWILLDMTPYLYCYSKLSLIHKNKEYKFHAYIQVTPFLNYSKMQDQTPQIRICPPMNQWNLLEGL
jgi:hypothetical protein